MSPGQPEPRTVAADFVWIACSSEQDRQEFIKEVLSEHNTRQQRTMHMLMELVEAFAEMEYVDGRNRATQALAAAITRNIDPQLRVLPAI